MKFGLTTDQYQFVVETVVGPLRKQGAKVYCYGSRARGEQQEFSDLDLMVESPDDLSRQIAVFCEDLTSSNFPYKVDLVEFSQFADTYKPGYFKDRVEF